MVERDRGGLGLPIVGALSTHGACVQAIERRVVPSETARLNCERALAGRLRSRSHLIYMTLDGEVEGKEVRAVVRSNGDPVLRPGALGQAQGPGQKGGLDRPALNQSPVRAFDPARIRSLVNRIVASGQFSQDTPLGRILHPGFQIAFRRRSERDSLHIGIGETQLSAHIDRVSPLSSRQGRLPATYSPLRVLAHLLARGARIVSGRRIPVSVRIEAPIVAAGSAVGATAPMSPLEEAVCLLDSPLEPWTVQAEVALPGRLETDRLRSAVEQAMAAHAMARARRRTQGRRATWELPVAADLDPVEELSLPAGGSLEQVRSDLYSLSVPLTASPPFRIRLVHRPEGDQLMLSAHHAAIDGVGAFAFLASVAAAYRGEAPLPDELGLHDLSARGRTGRLARARTALVEAAQLARGSAHLAPQGGHPAAGYGVHHHGLTAEQASVPPVLAAALFAAMHRWNVAHGEPDGRLTLYLTERMCPAPAVGNSLCMVGVSTRPDQRTEPRLLLEAVAARLACIEQRHSAAALVGLFGALQHLPRLIKPAVAQRVIADPFVPGAVLSNLGVAPTLDFGPAAGQAVGAWTSPPAMMPEGLSIGVVTLDGRMTLSLRYRHPLWGPAEAAEFCARYTAAIDEFAGLLSWPSGQDIGAGHGPGVGACHGAC